MMSKSRNSTNNGRCPVAGSVTPSPMATTTTTTMVTMGPRMAASAAGTLVNAGVQWSALWLAIAALASLGGPSGALAGPLSTLGGGPALNYRDVVVQQTPIRIIRCPQCETNALILATEADVSRPKKSGFSDQRIAELEGMLMNNRIRKSGFSDQRLAEMEAALLNGSKMRRSGFSDQRIAEMEAMLMNSMKRPAQRAITPTEQSR